MQAADPLFRRPNHEEGVNFDNRDQTLLQSEFFAVHAIKAVHDSSVNNDQILREVKEALLFNEVTKSYYSLLKSELCKFEKSMQD